MPGGNGTAGACPSLPSAHARGTGTAGACPSLPGLLPGFGAALLLPRATWPGKSLSEHSSTTEQPLCDTHKAQGGFPELTPGKAAAAQGELLFFAFFSLNQFFFSLTNF